MLNIAFLLATTGLPSPLEMTWVSGLSALTAGFTVTFGSAPKAPETVSPEIFEPMSTSDALDDPESLPQAAVAKSIRDAVSRTSRRRTKEHLERDGKNEPPTITGLPESSALASGNGQRAGATFPRSACGPARRAPGTGPCTRRSAGPGR